jgi:O-antigen ligase
MTPLFPRAAAALLLAALPWLNPMSYGPSAAVVPWFVSALCAILLWATASVSFRRTLVPQRLAWIGAGFVLWAIVSHLPPQPDALMLAGGLVLVVLGAAAARARELGPALQAGLLAAAVLNALFGLLQYFGAAAALAPVVNLAQVGEAFGNLRQTNQFATLCWMGVAIVLLGTLRLRRAAAVLLLVLLAVGSAASVSRTGMLEILALLLLCGWWGGADRRRRLLLGALAAAVYAAGAVLLPVLLETVTGVAADRTLWGRLQGADACFSRRVLWSNVLHLIAQKPLAGWGWGELDYAHYLTLYSGARFCDILDNAHNLPLHLAVELGVPAALAVCGAALVWAWKQRPWGESQPLRRLAWALLALILLHSLLEYPLWYGPFQIGLGLALGWLLPEPDAGAGEQPRLHGAAVATALLALLGHAAWDYARVSQIYVAPDARWAPWREDTLQHARASWLFGGQARFAELTLATPERANARWMYPLALRALHYSPEPRVIQRVIESAVLSGHEDEAVLHLARFRAAFPDDYGKWRERQRQPLPPTR